MDQPFAESIQLGIILDVLCNVDDLIWVQPDALALLTAIQKNIRVICIIKLPHGKVTRWAHPHRIILARPQCLSRLKCQLHAGLNVSFSCHHHCQRLKLLTRDPDAPACRADMKLDMLMLLSPQRSRTPWALHYKFPSGIFMI